MHAAVGIRGILERERAIDFTQRVLSAKKAWTADFNGEQFALGRAFYTHLETGQSKAYFDNAAESDRIVETHCPGLQSFALDCLQSMLGGIVKQRRGFCGPGVHVFPAFGKVAKEGGAIHFDLEGLTPHQIKKRLRAMTLVIMLQPGERGGGLRVWDALFDGRSDFEIDSDGLPHETIRARAGDALLIDSYRLHQIRPFAGNRDRISITVHALETDRNIFEAWF